MRRCCPWTAGDKWSEQNLNWDLSTSCCGPCAGPLCRRRGGSPLLRLLVALVRDADAPLRAPAAAAAAGERGGGAGRGGGRKGAVRAQIRVRHGLAGVSCEDTERPPRPRARRPRALHQAIPRLSGRGPV